MKLKKVLAAFMAVSMAFMPMTALAADPTVDPSVTTAPATGDVTGEGEFEGFVKEEAFCVVLPTVTAEQLKFILDPQGLLKHKDGSKYASLNPGSIVFPETESTSSDVIYATNKSSYNVRLDVSLNMKNTTTVPVTFLSDKSKVNQDDNLNVYFAAIPEKVKIADKSATITSDPSAIAFPIDNALSTSFAYDIDGKPANYETTYKTDEDKYEYNIRSGINEDTDWDTVGFTLTGTCNPNADWTEYNEKANAASDAENLSCTLAWTMTKTEGDTEDYTTTDNPACLIKTEAAPSVTSANTLEYSAASNGDVTINYSLGNGDLAAAKLVNVYITHGGQYFDLLSSQYASYVETTASSIVIKENWMKLYTTLPSTANVHFLFELADGTIQKIDTDNPDVVITVKE